MLTVALAARRAITTSMYPLLQARWRAVRPLCFISKQKSNAYLQNRHNLISSNRDVKLKMNANKKLNKQLK